MSVDPAILRAMLNAGCTAEQIVAVVEDADRAQEEKRAAKRANNAERQRRFRERHAVSRVTGVSDCDGPLDKETPPTPPKEIKPPCVVSSPAREGFADFWNAYPHKVGKRDALKAFERAAARAPLETIFAGLRAYVAKTDDRPWCNPSTWLNQDRWEDAPAEPPRQQARGSPPREKTMTEAIDERLRRMQANEPGYTIDADYAADGTADRPAVVHRLAAPSGSRR